MNAKKTRISYLLAAMASLFLVTGIAVLSHPEGTDTEWID